MELDYTALRLIIPERKDSERRFVVKAWQQKGGDVVSLREFWKPFDRGSGGVRCYGGTVFCETLAERWELTLLSPAEDLLFQLPWAWTKRRISILALKDLGADEFPLFVKPVNIGLFESGVFLSQVGVEGLCRGLPPATQVLVADVVKFEAEVRTFALGGKVVDCSAYYGTASLKEACLFAESFLAFAESLPLSVVVDVGFIRGRGWAVVEANPVWASALRGCKAELVLPCIAAASLC